MRLGLIARADQSGLGTQSWEFYQHMHPDKVLVIDVSSEYGPGNENKKLRYTYPGAQIVRGWSPQRWQIEQFLDGLDVVYSAETPYGWQLVNLANQRGIRTYIHVNSEFCEHLLEPTLPKPTLFLAPTSWYFDRLPEPKLLLPVPVAVERFGLPPRSAPARSFLHTVGRPAAHDRAGTGELIDAIPHIKSRIELTIFSLDTGYVSGLLHFAGVKIPDNVVLRVLGEVDHYQDLYKGQDVAILPRRWGGLSLPLQEALGAGLPVVLGAHDPCAAQLPAEWAIPSRQVDRFMTRTEVAVHSMDPVGLAAVIDRFASDERFVADGYATAAEWAGRNSWDALKPLYEQILASV